MKTLLKNCYIISPNIDKTVLQDIYVEKGIIEEIGLDLEKPDARILDMRGSMILPGFIDMHCNICDPGFENIEDIETVSQSALRGGFTTITCQPNTNPAIDNKTVVEYIVSKSKYKSIVNIYPYGSMSIGCDGEEMAEIGEMVEAGIVAISDGDKSIDQAYFLRNVMLYAKMFDLPVITHCEDKGLCGKGVMNAGAVATSLGLLGMPREAEEVIVGRNILLAETTGAKLHIAHVSTKGSVQLIREAKNRGVKLTAETCPHYFLLTDEAVGEYNTLMKFNPPLRNQEDVEGLLKGIADGTIDVISTGHSPSAQRDKETLFDYAVFGISSLETLFPLCHTHLVEKDIISLERLVEMVSTAPAKILKLENKGIIEKGKDADLVTVDLKETFIIDPSHFASKAKFSPFTNEEVKGKIIEGMVGGKILM